MDVSYVGCVSELGLRPACTCKADVLLGHALMMNEVSSLSIWADVSGRETSGLTFCA